MDDPQSAGACAYTSAVMSILDRVTQTQGAAITHAASVIISSIKLDGMVYLFGTGHSHMLAEEGHDRAGGLASVCPILYSSLMIHESATMAGRLERTPDLAPAILSKYQLTAKDILIIFSNSGVNAVPVEMAILAKKIGLTVIAVVAVEYSRQAPLSALGKRLTDIADIVIDNQGPPGDAVVDIPETGLRVGPSSTIVGAFILNAIFTEVAWRLAAAGYTPPIYISGNLPGAAEHNSVIRNKYYNRNPHL